MVNRRPSSSPWHKAPRPRRTAPPTHAAGERTSGHSAGRKQCWPALLAVLFLGAGCALDQRADSAAVRDEEITGFVEAAGRGLAIEGEPARLKAVNFSNLYHRNLDATDLLDSPHHGEEDFAQVKNMGFNSVRFAFDGDWYRDDPEVFWQWLDRNVEWARQHGVRLILDLHTPIGGFWLDPTSDDVSFDIWSDPRLQRQNADMWREIADRYKDEPVIAAYDLLNEPVTTDGTGRQWQNLAQQLVTAVRSVDEKHLLVVGGLYGINGRYGTDGMDPHFLVDDENVMYDFHFYEPVKYTHQYASWVEGPIQDGGAYPDPDVILPTGERRLLPDSRITTRSMPTGTSDWAVYDSGKVTIEDDSAVAAMPMAVVEGGMRGTAHFDAIEVTEYDSDGKEIRVVVDAPLSGDATLDWYQWASGGDATSPVRFSRDTEGHDDDASLSITDASSAGSIAGWSTDTHLFEVVPGNQYRIQGYMRGDNVVGSTRDTPRIGLQLDVYAESPGGAGGGFLERDRAYLAHEMEKHLRFGAEHGVPMSVMEFGVVKQAFDMEGKGGDRWVADMLALLEENDLSFAYWEYHGAEMGLYLSGNGKPSEPNTALHDVLRRELQ
jgi:endoglucanase